VIWNRRQGAPSKHVNFFEFIWTRGDERRKSVALFSSASQSRIFEIVSAASVFLAGKLVAHIRQQEYRRAPL